MKTIFRIFYFLMVFCPAGSLLIAQGNLMVTSIPLRAEIYINGELQPQVTPAIFRDLKAALYDITIRKTGFEDYRTQITITDQKTTILEKSFQPEIMRLSFPDIAELTLGNDEIDYQGKILTVPSANYEMELMEDHLYLYPIYPGQDTMGLINISLPFLSGLAAIGWISDLTHSTENPDSIDTEREWTMTTSLGTIILTGSALGLGFWQIWLSADRDKYYKDFDIKSKLLGTANGQDWEYFKQAQDLLAQNKRNEAIKFFELVISGYPESAYMPESHYRLSKLYRLEGNQTKAIYHLKKIVEVYPVPALYDRSCKGLADLLSDLEIRISYLKLMVFVDELYIRGGIEEEIKALEATLDIGQ